MRRVLSFLVFVGVPRVDCYSPANLLELQQSGWKSKSVQTGNSRHFIRMLSGDEVLYPGIVGYDHTVIPEINIALLAGHDMLFLGEKGQAKSRLMRGLVRFSMSMFPT